MSRPLTWLIAIGFLVAGCFVWLVDRVIREARGETK